MTGGRGSRNTMTVCERITGGWRGGEEKLGSWGGRRLSDVLQKLGGAEGGGGTSERLWFGREAS